MSLGNNKYWRVNDQISAREIRVIGQDGKQVGVLEREKALAEAEKAGLDLIEIAPLARPPVAKIADLKKFLYLEEKKKRIEKRKAKTVEVKEIRFSPFIAENDYNVRLERIKEFLSEGHKVKCVVVFKPRQLGRKAFGYDILKKTTDTLGESIKVDMQPKFIGRYLTMIITPNKKSGASQNAEIKDQESTN